MNQVKIIFIAIMISAGFLLAQTSKGITIKEKAGNEGKRWAICVGINNYDYDGILDLKKARNDAEALGQVFEDFGQFDYVYVLSDKNDPRSPEYPTLRKIKSKLDYLKDFLEPEDLVVFSFSGHGITDEKGDSYLVLADTDPDDIFNSSLKLKEVTDTFQSAGVKKSLLLVDACREAFQKNKGINKNGLKSQKFEKSEVAATFYATKNGWFSYEDESSDYGAFTNYILKGLEGEADNQDYAGNNDGIVSFTELATFVEDGVTDWALENSKRQKPYTKIYGEKYGDLALSSYNGIVKKEELKITKQKIEITDTKKKIENKLSSKFGIDMIFVEGDTFQMGNDFKKGKGDEKPLHIVSVDDYYMSKYEITQSQWIEIMRYNPSKFKGENKPIGRVKWIEAIEYCNKLSEFEGLEKCYLGNKLNIVCDFTASGYRLPTEAEWEFAARGGVKSIGYKYSGSDDIQNVGWYGDNSERELHDVGKKKSNELGICDMSGNIHEWCWDWYDDDYYKNSSNDNPIGPELGKIRVMRGGYWSNNEFNCRVSSRFNYSPDGSKGSGFRVVRRP